MAAIKIQVLLFVTSSSFQSHASLACSQRMISLEMAESLLLLFDRKLEESLLLFKRYLTIGLTDETLASYFGSNQLMQSS